MREKSFFIHLSDTNRIRVWISKNHKIGEFVVQYEALVGEGWREVVRFDNRGKPAHRDNFDPSGKKYKSPLPDIEPERLIPSCVKDLHENWPEYKARYLRRMLSSESSGG